MTWSRSRARAFAWQALVVAAVCAAGVLLVHQTAENLRLRGLASGFDYLGRMAGFEIAPGPWPFSSRDTFARALEVGLLNTLRVSLLSMFIAAALGVTIGLARLSTVPIVSAVAATIVELLRNTPLLLQMFFWYSLSQALPGPHEALRPLPGVFLSARGLFMPGLDWHDGGIGLARPVLGRFDFHGGLSISPEFAALVIGLSTYTAAFIGEIVRGGVLAVDRGQKEAAAALGLPRGKVLRFVVLPQALRVIIPSATSQFVNLVKNSSLAVAIGYPDLMAITNITLNQTGQAIEAIALTATVYFAVSSIVSLGMNAWNRSQTPAVGART